MAITSKPPSFGTFWEIDPVLMPNEAADLVASTVYVDLIHLVNESAADVTVILLDKQSTPRSLAGSAAKEQTIAAGSEYIKSFPGGRKCPGGINWVCSAANAVTAYMSGRY